MGTGTRQRFGETQADAVDRGLLDPFPSHLPQALFPWLLWAWGHEVREGPTQTLLWVSV